MLPFRRREKWGSERSVNLVQSHRTVVESAFKSIWHHSWCSLYDLFFHSQHLQRSVIKDTRVTNHLGISQKNLGWSWVEPSWHIITEPKSSVELQQSHSKTPQRSRTKTLPSPDTWWSIMFLQILLERKFRTMSTCGGVKRVPGLKLEGLSP